MARTFVYSFEDTAVTISHPQFGTYSAYGTGIGSIAIAYAEDESTMDVAADLAVVVSKHVRKHGTVTFNVLQSSDFNNWLKKLTAYLETANTDQWVLGTINVTNKSTGDNYFCEGVCPSRQPQNNFQSQAQQREWVMNCANIINK